MKRLLGYTFFVLIIVLPYFQEFMPGVLYIISEYLIQFRLQITYILSAFVLYHVVSRHYLDVFLTTMLVVLSFFSIYFPLADRSACDSDSKNILRVMSFNVYKDNQKRQKISDFISRHDPDIAWLLETRVAEVHGLLNNLEYQYPHFYPEKSKIRSQGSVLISKYPFEVKKEIFHDTQRYGQVFHAVLNVDFEEIDVFGIHFRSPRSAEHVKIRNKQIRQTIDYIRQFRTQKRFILLGDMNSVFWHREIKNLRYAFDLNIGNTLFKPNGTWSSHYPEFLQVPIDQIMTSSHLCLKDIQKLDSYGSDHHGLLGIIKY